MASAIASVVYVMGIVGLFVLDRDQKPHTSKALWIPVAWLLAVGSRPLPLWLMTGPTMVSADTFNIESNAINIAVFSVLLAAGSMVLVRRKEQVGALLRENWPIILFFSYCALSTLWSDYPAAAFRKWIRSMGDLVMVVIVLTDYEPAVALKRLLARAGFLLLPLSVLLIKYYPDLGRAYSNSWELMYTGVTQHKNSLGAICLIIGLGFLWRFFEHYRTENQLHRRRHLLADGAILITTMWLLWVANSATSSACFLMAAALMAVSSLPAAHRKLEVVHLLVAALVGLSLFALFFDSGGDLVEAIGRSRTLTGRTEVWQQVIRMAGNPVFGTGFESFWLGGRLQEIWINNVGATLNEAHNGYLEVYLNLGWSGVTLLAVLILTGYRNVIVTFRQDRHVGALKLAYFVAAVIYSLTEAGFRMLSPVWLFFLLATIAVPEPSVMSAPNVEKQVSPRDYWIRQHQGVS